jgi:hypothetical protein
MLVTDSTVKFWTDLKVGDIVNISDSQAIEQDMQDNDEIDGIEYAITSIDTYSIKDDLGTFKFFNLKDMSEQSQALKMVVKIIDNEIDHFIYFQIDDIPVGNRVDFLEQGFEFFFSNHEEDIDPLDLEFNPDLSDPTGKVYNKYMETLGEIGHVPAESGIDEPLMCQVVEYLYEGEEEVENERLMIIEEGDGECGGLITLLSGTTLTLADIEIYKQ